MILRSYQRDAVDCTWDYLRNNQRGAPVVDLPTGSGKSHVIAELCRQTVEWGGRAIVISHRKELLVQDAEKIQALLPQKCIGIYSAGLKSRDVDHAIVCAGIQSCYTKAHLFGMRNLVIVDEAHLVSLHDSSMYSQCLMELSSLCPGIRLIGLTATPYRLDCGPICAPNGVFTKVCYRASLRQLMTDGYLSLLTNKTSKQAFDLSGVARRGGEYVPGAMESAFNENQQAVEMACREIVDSTQGRKSVLVFAAGVRHAENVQQVLQAIAGERVGLIVGETDSLERSATLSAFKHGSLRFCVNCMVLTCGFDHPGIDAIAVLRATLSPGLFAQIVGRGLRIAPGKTDALILDFGNNIERHGPLDADDYGVEKVVKGESSGAPIKKCPGCGELIPASATVCMFCGLEMPRELRHDPTADKDNNILVEPTTYVVTGATANLHRKKDADPGAPPTMRITYTCQLPGVSGNLTNKYISEWVCIEHEGYARNKAVSWWRQCSMTAVPDTVEHAVALYALGACGLPSELTTIPDGHFTRITGRVVSKAAAVGDAIEPEVDEFAPPPEMIYDELNCPF